MRLLVLSSWYPFPADNGSRLRAYYLLRELANYHTIRLIAGVQNDTPEGYRNTPPPELRELCESVVAVPWKWHQAEGGGLSGALLSLFSIVPRSILETFDPDVLQTIQQSTASFAPEAVVVLELGMDMYRDGLPSGTPILIDQVEVSGSARAYHEATGVLPRLRAQLTYEKSRKYWSDRLSCYHAVTAVSQEEATAVRQVIGSGNPPVLVVPNGVNLAGYDNRDRDRMVPGRLLYNGAMTYTLNREAVLWFVREILPTVAQAVPEAHLVVTGRYNEESVEELLVNPRVHLTGFLPELTEILAQSAVCVVPLLAGGGTRLKILEAWAAGLPVVSTSIGAKGLEAKDGIHLLLGDNAETFAQQTIALLRNSSQAEQIADNARRYVTERFDWTAIGAQLSNHIEKMVTQTL